MLWFRPTLVRRTVTPISSVLDANLSLLRTGILESSYDAAAKTAGDLASERTLLGLPTTTTTVPVVTTTTVVQGAQPSTTTVARH
jgi:hypothetical protein